MDRGPCSGLKSVLTNRLRIIHHGCLSPEKRHVNSSVVIFRQRYEGVAFHLKPGETFIQITI